MLVGVREYLLHICVGRISALFFTMKGKVLEFRIGNFLVFVKSYVHQFPVWAERSIKNSFLAFGLGGVWDGGYRAWIFPNSLARIHFCFLSGHWDEFMEDEQKFWEFEHQQALARARMRLSVPDFSQSAFDSILDDLTEEELDAIPF
jgi:hypothetical protein